MRPPCQYLPLSIACLTRQDAQSYLRGWPMPIHLCLMARMILKSKSCLCSPFQSMIVKFLSEMDFWSWIDNLSCLEYLSYSLQNYPLTFEPQGLEIVPPEKYNKIMLNDVSYSYILSHTAGVFTWQLHSVSWLPQIAIFKFQIANTMHAVSVFSTLK